MQTVVLSSTNDKSISVTIDQLDNLTESEMLENFDKRTLKTLNYSIKQVIGSIYLKISEAKNELLLSKNKKSY